MAENPLHRSIDPDPAARPKEPAKELSMDDALIQKLEAIVRERMSDEQFSVSELADAIAMSRSHLHRRLNSIVGVSTSQFIRSMRLARGMELLQQDVGNVSEVAYRVGFASNTYFTRCFTDEYGYSPGEVRKGKVEPVAKQEEIISEPHGSMGKSEISPQTTPLFEAFHPNSSEELVREVFLAMAEVKPSLQKFMLVEEDEGEVLDIRLLAYQIIKYFPWVIGVELRRLFSANLLTSLEQRYAQLDRTINRLLEVLTFIMASEYFKALESGNKKLKKITAPEMGRGLNPEGFKDRSVFLKALDKSLRSCEHSCFIDALPDLLDASFYRELDDWSRIATPVNWVSDEARQGCEQLEQTLVYLLVKLAFLAEYKMVQVSSIEVKKRKFSNAHFDHRLRILNSTDAQFKKHAELADHFSDSGSVLLLRSIKDTGDYLNLSPFIVDTQDDDLSNLKAAGLRSDIYLLRSWDQSEAKYVGVNAQAEVDLAQWSHWPDLQIEFERMKEAVQ